MSDAADFNDRLLVDVGNTRIKALLYRFQQGEESFDSKALSVSHDRDFERAFAEVMAKSSRSKDVWVSNVAGEKARLAIESLCLDNWGVKPNFARVERSQYGIDNSYLNLDELGVDRWMAIQGARQLCEGALIVIGCGTAITVDFLSEDNVFKGGAILPGLELAANALSHADGIPRFDFQEYTHSLGTTTADCVRVGAINSCAGGVEKIVASIIKQFPNVSIQILASGGAAEAVLSATKIKFQYDANLVLRGLQRVANKRLS